MGIFGRKSVEGITRSWMTPRLGLWGLQILNLALNTASQFMPPPGLPFPYPPQIPDGAPMPPMPPLPPMSLPPSPQQLPMSMPMPMHQPRIPMVVMPYYSKNEKSAVKYRKKKRLAPKRHFEDSSSESEGLDSASHEFDFRAKKRTKKNRHQVLTPVVSYITKDGYVVYQKKIKKDRAKDWLEIGKKKEMIGSHDEESGELLEDVKHRLRRAKKRSRDQ